MKNESLQTFPTIFDRGDKNQTNRENFQEDEINKSINQMHIHQ